MPVHLILANSSGAFRQAVTELVVDAESPFVMLTSLSHRGEAGIAELIHKVGAHYVVLAEELQIGEDGELTAKASLTDLIEPGAEAGFTADYVFRRTGKHWEIVFDGEKVPPLPDFRGLRLFAVLLQNPGTEFSPVELEERAGVVPAKVLSRRQTELEGLTVYFPAGFHPDLESDSRASYRRLGRKIEAERQMAEEEGLVGRAEELRAAKEHLDDLIISTFAGKAWKNTADRVSKNLDRCCELIGSRDGHKELAKHLSNALDRPWSISRRGKKYSKWVYRREHAVPWSF